MVNQENPIKKELLSEESNSSSEVYNLKKRIEELEGKLEKEDIPEKEKSLEARKEIKAHLQSFQKTSSKAMSIEERDEVEEIAKFSRPQQISSLISLALEKGVEEAVNVARALDNPAILDEFHDTLIDRYYEELVKKGKINK